MIKKLFMSFFAIINIFYGVSFATDTKWIGETIDDQVLEKNINSTLKAQVPSGNFTVASYKQDVLLAGQVPTLTLKLKAENSVKNVVGVKKVWNHLKISTNETPADLAKDALLTTTAKARLIAQKEVNANNIKVVTSNRIVYLLGDNAGDNKQLNGAIQGIKNIDGAKDVINLIN